MAIVLNAQMDSLSKYSYPIFASHHNNTQLSTGTGFFYKSKGKVYLVSNYHSIIGIDPMKKSINFLTDIIYVRFKLKKKLVDTLVAIDVSERAVGKKNVYSLMDSIDLYRVAVQLPATVEVNYINALVSTEFFNKKPLAVYSYGYPGRDGSSQMQELIRVPVEKFEGVYNNRGYSNYDSAIKKNFPLLPDYDRKVLLSSERFYFFITPLARHGFSGSPVFGKFLVNKKKNTYTYKFIGVIFGQEGNVLQTWAIKAKVAYDYFSK
jgi:hypothetical protein